MQACRFRSVAALLVSLGLVGCTTWQPTTPTPRRVIEDERPSHLSVQQGDTIRARAAEDGDARTLHEGTYVGFSGDTLWYRAQDGAAVGIPSQGLSLEVPTSDDKGSEWGMIGGLVGVALGGLLAHAAFEPEFETFAYENCADWEIVLIIPTCVQWETISERRQVNSLAESSEPWLIAGFVLGAAVGWGMGSSHQIWERIELDELAVTSNQATLSFSLR